MNMKTRDYSAAYYIGFYLLRRLLFVFSITYLGDFIVF